MTSPYLHTCATRNLPSSSLLSNVHARHVSTQVRTVQRSNVSVSWGCESAPVPVSIPIKKPPYPIPNTPVMLVLSPMLCHRVLFLLHSAPFLVPTFTPLSPRPCALNDDLGRPRPRATLGLGLKPKHLAHQATRLRHGALPRAASVLHSGAHDASSGGSVVVGGGSAAPRAAAAAAALRIVGIGGVGGVGVGARRHGAREQVRQADDEEGDEQRAGEEGDGLARARVQGRRHGGCGAVEPFGWLCGLGVAIQVGMCTLGRRGDWIWPGVFSSFFLPWIAH